MPRKAKSVSELEPIKSTTNVSSSKKKASSSSAKEPKKTATTKKRPINLGVFLFLLNLLLC